MLYYCRLNDAVKTSEHVIIIGEGDPSVIQAYVMLSKIEHLKGRLEQALAYAIKATDLLDEENLAILVSILATLSR